MKRRILVTGAAGKTSSGVVEILRKRNLSVRALVRRADDRSKRLADLGAEIVIGNMLSHSDVRSAVSDMDSAYFCYPTLDTVLEATAIFSAAAASAGLKFAVNISQIIARPNAPSPTSRMHWLAEQILENTILDITHVRPTFFADHFVRNTKQTIANDDQIVRPYGNAFHSPIVSSDISRVVAAILIDPLPHFGNSYALTGVDRLSFPEIAAMFSKLLGRSIEYVDISIDDFKADMEQRQVSSSLMEHHLAASKDYREGMFDATNDLVEQITGTPAVPFQQYIKQNISAFAAVSR